MFDCFSFHFSSEHKRIVFLNELNVAKLYVIYFSQSNPTTTTVGVWLSIYFLWLISNHMSSFIFVLTFSFGWRIFNFLLYSYFSGLNCFFFLFSCSNSVLQSMLFLNFGFTFFSLSSPDRTPEGAPNKCITTDCYGVTLPFDKW